MKYFYLLVLVVLGFSLKAQDINNVAITAEEKKKIEEDTANGWKFGGLGGITFNQAAFVNWAAGGTNSISMNANVRFYADFKKNKHLLQSWLAAEYGVQYSKQTIPKLAKNADRWEIFSKYGYKVTKKMYVGAYADLRSQFNKTYKANQVDSGLISAAVSPLIFESAIGIDYLPNQYFSMFFSPLATKVTYVGDDFLAEFGGFGNKYPKRVKPEFGATLIAQYNQSFWKQNISVNSIFRAYKNYLFAAVDPFDNTIRETNASYRKNIDVDWQTTLGFKVNKYITASVFTYLIWDHDVLIEKTEGATTTTQPRLQFRDVIGIGLMYQTNYFKAKKTKPVQL
jgi:hypothetical protein